MTSAQKRLLYLDVCVLTAFQAMAMTFQTTIMVMTRTTKGDAMMNPAVCRIVCWTEVMPFYDVRVKTQRLLW